MKLYEISAEYADFLAAVEAGEIPEEAIADTLSCIEGEFEEKADNLACIIKQLRAEAKAIKAEAAVLSDRAEAKKGRSDTLVNYLLGQMQAVGKSKIETPRNAITVAKNPDSVNIVDERTLYMFRPDLFTAAVPMPSKTAIKAAIKGGEDVPGVELVGSYGLRVK